MINHGFLYFNLHLSTFKIEYAVIQAIAAVILPMNWVCKITLYKK